jgi:hypothetical protein
MAASRRAGLRPVPQSVCTPAAGAAWQTIGLGARNQNSSKSVFSGHSTQSLIAARLRRGAVGFKELGVDRDVYGHLRSVDESLPTRLQVAEYLALGAYTAQARVRGA